MSLTSVNTLEHLYVQDQEDRKSVNWEKAGHLENQWLKKRDNYRRAKTYSLYKKGEISSASDYHKAALILQHGDNPKDYRFAHRFAKKAVKDGDTSALWLCAATLDRLLISIGKPQKYGTQFRLNKNRKWEVILPIDPTVTDEDRSKYGVPPVVQALQKLRTTSRWIALVQQIDNRTANLQTG